LPFIAAEGLEVSHEQILALRVGYRVTLWIQFPHCKAAAVVDSIIYTRVMIWCSATNIEKRFPSSISGKEVSDGFLNSLLIAARYLRDAYYQAPGFLKVTLLFAFNLRVNRCAL